MHILYHVSIFFGYTFFGWLKYLIQELSPVTWRQVMLVLVDRIKCTCHVTIDFHLALLKGRRNMQEGNNHWLHEGDYFTLSSMINKKNWKLKLHLSSAISTKLFILDLAFLSYIWIHQLYVRRHIHIFITLYLHESKFMNRKKYFQFLIIINR